MIDASGGLDGHQVNVIVEDDAGDGGRALTEAKSLVQDHHVIALVASAAALTEASWATYIESAHVPVIGGDCATPQWNSNPDFFPQCATPGTQAFGLVKWGEQVLGKGTKWGDVYCIEAASVCGNLDQDWNARGYAKAAGLVPVYRGAISLAQPDFTTNCLSARSKGVRALTALGDADTVIRVARSCSQQGYKPTFVQGSATVTAQTPQNVGLSNLTLEVPTFPFTGLNTPATRTFAAAYAKYGQGAEPGPGASLGWASAELFQQVATIAARTGHIVAGSITDALWSLKRDTVGGLTPPLTFVKGKPAPDARCWFVMRAVNGKWTDPHGGRVSCR